MKFISVQLKDCYLIELEPFMDERGWFARYFCKNEFRSIGHNKEWVQLNHSFTSKKGTIRGMHFQYPPFREIKLVRCISGSVFDVVIDLRKESDTYLKWFGVELSAQNKRMIFIPEGFAHGFQSLTDHCELLYHHTEYFNKEAEGGIRYNDPGIDIQWPLPVEALSDRDSSHPFLNEKFKGI